MKNKRLFIGSSICLILVLAVFFLMTGCAPAPAADPAPPAEADPAPTPAEDPPPPPAEPTVIKAVTFLPVGFIATEHAHRYVEEIEQRSNGQLIIDIIGAGDVIPTEEQIFAVKEGRIDMIFSCGDDISQASPMGFAMILTGMDVWEEREAGIWDFYREIFARDCNAYYLGSLQHPMWWNLFTNVEAKSPDDIKGLKIRCGATHFGSVAAVGAEPISTPMMEIYTAMERGMIDGFVFPPCGWTQFGWHEVTDYWVGPRLVRGQNSTPLINLDVWNSLTQEEQDLLTQTVIDIEQDMFDLHWWIWTGDEYGEESILNAGVQHIKWSDEDSEMFQEAWKNALWDYVEDQVRPDDFARFKELVGH